MRTKTIGTRKLPRPSLERRPGSERPRPSASPSLLSPTSEHDCSLAARLRTLLQLGMHRPRGRRDRRCGRWRQHHPERGHAVRRNLPTMGLRVPRGVHWGVRGRRVHHRMQWQGRLQGRPSHVPRRPRLSRVMRGREELREDGRRVRAARRVRSAMPRRWRLPPSDLVRSGHGNDAPGLRRRARRLQRRRGAV